MARGYGGQGNPFGALYMLLSLLSAGLCVAILIIVNRYLWYGAYCVWNGSTTICYAQNRCYMQTVGSQSDLNLCYYSWAAGGVGLFFALCIFFMQVCSGRNRHIPTCEVLVCILSLLWWIGAATTGTVYGQNADDVAVMPGVSGTAVDTQVLHDKQGYRTAVWAMGWANVGLWAICALVSLKDCISMRGQAPPVPGTAGASGYPTGAYAQPVYQQQQTVYYAAAPAAPAAGYPPAGYPAQPQQPYQYQPSPFAAAPAPGYPPTQAV